MLFRSDTALGYQALKVNTASDNTAIGAYTLLGNVGGLSNVAVGALAMITNISGSYNTAVGAGIAGSLQGALGLNTSGSNNTAIGYAALRGNDTASNNTAVGYQAGYSNTTGANSVYLGIGAGRLNTTGSDNCMAGYYAGENTTGGGNTFFGKLAGNAVTSGTKNTIIGSYNGNQNSVDIRTLSNYIVLSDGDGYPAFWGLGGASGYMRLQAGRLEFPATQNASSDPNTLDDYEEGTWTPTATPATSGTITVGSPNLCSYTKIGRVVTVSGLLEVSSVSTPIGASVTIGGLIFTSNSETNQRSAGTAVCVNLTSGTVSTTCLIVSSATSFIVQINASLFQAASQIYFQLTYTV